MNSTNDDYDELEQYDYSTGEFLEKVAEKYYPLIGELLIVFSELEQELNIAIADFIHDDSHETGFVIIEKLTTRNKIELFYKLYVRLESFKDKKNKIILGEIRKELDKVNIFRNNVVHANWQSLTKEGYVRTKIMVDTEEGYIKFKKALITPKIICQKIQEVYELLDKIDKYKESAFNF